MKVHLYPEHSTWASLLARPSLEAQDLDQIVATVLDEVRKAGDTALKRYTARFDHAQLDHIALGPPTWMQQRRKYRQHSGKPCRPQQRISPASTRHNATKVLK